jgi:hypothetical protein
MKIIIGAIISLLIISCVTPVPEWHGKVYVYEPDLPGLIRMNDNGNGYEQIICPIYCEYNCNPACKDFYAIQSAALQELMQNYHQCLVNQKKAMRYIKGK